MKLNDLLLRSLTSIVYAALWLIGALFSYHVLVLVTGFFAVVSVGELSRLLNQRRGVRNLVIGISIFVWLLNGLFLLNSVFEVGTFLFFWHLVFYLFPILTLLFFAYFVFREKENNLHSYFFFILSCVYVIFPLQGLVFLSFVDFSPKNEYSLFYNELMFVLLVVWSYDTLAYIFGSSFGKIPLLPSVSPAKTWEGTLGGTIVTLLWVGIYVFIAGKEGLINALISAFLLIIFATIGDLFESKLKRIAKVKDSGNILPGHGGMLDRLDSLLMASMMYVPVVLIKDYLLW